MYGDPEFEALASLRSRIGKQLARLVENNRLSDQDMVWALQQLPTIPSLNTEKGRLVFATKIDSVEKELARRAATKQQLSPALFPRQPTSDPLLEELWRKHGGGQ